MRCRPPRSRASAASRRPSSAARWGSGASTCRRDAAPVGAAMASRRRRRAHVREPTSSIARSRPARSIRSRSGCSSSTPTGSSSARESTWSTVSSRACARRTARFDAILDDGAGSCGGRRRRRPGTSATARTCRRGPPALPAGRAAHTCDARPLRRARRGARADRRRAAERLRVGGADPRARRGARSTSSIAMRFHASSASTGASPTSTSSARSRSPATGARLSDASATWSRGRFWEVGRLTLEPWLVPRLDWPGLRRRPGAEVAGDRRRAAIASPCGSPTRRRLEVDRVVLATGYRADLRARAVPRPACSTASRQPTGSPSSTRPSRPRCPACT